MLIMFFTTTIKRQICGMLFFNRCIAVYHRFLHYWASVMNLSKYTAEFKLINQLRVDLQLPLMHTTPFWLQQELSDRQQGSNVTLDLFVSTLTLGGRMRKMSGFRRHTCYLLRNVDEYNPIRFQLYYCVDLRKGRWTLWKLMCSSTQEKTALQHMWGWTTGQDFSLTFHPCVCIVNWLQQHSPKYSWWSDSIRKESNCIISLSTGPLSRVHPISCSLSSVAVEGGLSESPCMDLQS